MRGMATPTRAVLLRVLRRRLRILLPAALLAVLLAAGALAWVETEAVSSYWDGLWWSLSLVTTVGFVGAAPATVGGKIISSVLMVLGFVLLATTSAAVASLFVREDEIPEEERERRFERIVMAELAALRAELERLRRADAGGSGQAPDETDGRSRP